MVKVTSREEAINIYGERGGVAYDFVPMNWEGERVFMGEDVYVEKLPCFISTTWIGEPYLSRDELEAILQVGCRRFVGEPLDSTTKAKIISYCNKRISDFFLLGLFSPHKYCLKVDFRYGVIHVYVMNI